MPVTVMFQEGTCVTKARIWWVKLLADRNEVFFSAAPQARRLAVTS
jgi:hypothetical protein